MSLKSVKINQYLFIHTLFCTLLVFEKKNRKDQKEQKTHFLKKVFNATKIFPIITLKNAKKKIVI